MKMIKDKQLLVGADFAGYPLKEAVCAHLRKKGWEITDVGVTDPAAEDTELMFHRVGLRVGAMIAEYEFERALIFCGTGMGIHIAASKCPHVFAGVVESVPAALRAITGNGVNVLAMGAFYVARRWAAISRTRIWARSWAAATSGGIIFYEFHKLSIDELDAFKYEEYKKKRLQAQASGRLRHQARGQAGGLPALADALLKINV
jgi:ribose 5-phosphate isomerase B